MSITIDDVRHMKVGQVIDLERERIRRERGESGLRPVRTRRRVTPSLLGSVTGRDDDNDPPPTAA